MHHKGFPVMQERRAKALPWPGTQPPRVSLRVLDQTMPSNKGQLVQGLTRHPSVSSAIFMKSWVIGRIWRGSAQVSQAQHKK